RRHQPLHVSGFGEVQRTVVLLDEGAALSGNLGVELTSALDVCSLELDLDFAERPAHEELAKLVARSLADELAGQAGSSSRPRTQSWSGTCIVPMSPSAAFVRTRSRCVIARASICVADRATRSARSTSSAKPSRR